jgi:hypothetical protein
MAPCSGRTTLVAAFLAGLAAVAVASNQAADPPRPPTTEELVQRLSSKKYRDRDEATRLLLRRRDARASLQKARRSADPEVAKRAAWLLEELAKRSAEEAVARLRALAASGTLDGVAELLARWPTGREEVTCWAEARKLVLRLQDLNAKQGGGTSLPFLTAAKPRPLTLVAAERVTSRLPGLPNQQAFLVRAASVDLGRFHTCAVIGCSGPVRGREFGWCAVFASGPVDIDGIGACIIVSDADVTLRQGNKSLVIARGTVTCEGGVYKDCRFIAGKTVKLNHSTRLVDCKVTTHELNPLGFVRFFDPAILGITIEPAKTGMHVKAVAPGKPFAKAGLKAGDIVLAVNACPAKSPEEFRKLLRQSYVCDEDTVLRVDRGGKRLEVRVPPSPPGKP